MKNTYSDSWFEFFLHPAPSSRAHEEAAFIVRHLPRHRYSSVVDLCCGNGRHARLLAAAGYRVTAVDNNKKVVDEAINLGNDEIAYLALDMRKVAELQRPVDAFISMWQSFGYFDEETNLDVIRQIEHKLAANGRLILDVYHRKFFEEHQEVRRFEKSGVLITEHKRMIGNRLQVTLTYDDRAETDAFDWWLYTPDELSDELKVLGFNCLTACAEFDESRPATGEQPRMQLVFEKAG